MINYTKNKKGFTLVESLVAISILSLSILSTFTVVSSSLKSSSLAKEQVIAFYLAQEAMEYIKNVRDNNALASLNGGANTWLTGLSSAQADPCWYGLGGVGQKTCQINTITQVVTNCAGGLGSCAVLRIDPANNRQYGYNAGWTPTTFKREVQFTRVGGNFVVHEVRVTIFISWENHGVVKSFQVSQTLFNRQ